MADDLRDWFRLWLTPGVGPVVGGKLIHHFGTPAAALAAPYSELRAVGVPEETARAIVGQASEAAVERQLAALERSGGCVLTLADTAYPALLRAIPDPPLLLFVRGNLADAVAQPCLAIVGSRSCSTYGRNAANRLARDLASRGVTIVSGLARGIDTAAHEAALDAGGRTIAVLGTGLDDTYPRENAKLADRIAETGALVTEFPFEKPPAPQNFPYRNRVIAGLCLGVLVVEAAEQSGSLITARLALEQGREVFAVPGNITSGKSIGTNRLIQDGAKLVMDWQDVVAEFSYDLRQRLRTGQPAATPQESHLPFDLGEDEQCILALVGFDQPVYVDGLIVQSGLGQPRTMAALLNLTLRGLLRELPGKCYVRAWNG
ncbi:MULTISPECIES: DNA-processing protein DprA [Chloracidobacterium]|jgi:DNA processing protein|uniref:DNA protecting protein DprA n=3 Tax=Acidobacteriaceae TaxID=204434 RepID=G2LIF6_CHLTF|nr:MULTISPECIES: DNA-processing protein DprA [Chloracidobacterium]AEP11854.1 DNA protecting protein DprA [Chloracidobacterium thermophilum B]QUV85746.1 DNA-processing protein DprA [Chloracidobacterium sp. 2]QUV94955.1 DNA-processing protein DprA [Chloracidobacterium sp. N]QUV98012.1 DNA-processing protein DprA [Chloracidobacterium sp. E]QUV79717.1 DNA-processing protein DprA [Chloracidobacterium thermophilum]